VPQPICLTPLPKPLTTKVRRPRVGRLGTRTIPPPLDLEKGRAEAGGEGGRGGVRGEAHEPASPEGGGVGEKALAPLGGVDQALSAEALPEPRKLVCSRT